MPPTTNDFCRSFPWKLKWTWNGDKAWVKLPNGNVAHIDLSIGTGRGNYAIIGHYVAFHVKITNTTVGEVVSEYFYFDDHLKLLTAYNEHVKGFYVIDHCGWTWYCNTPTPASVKLFAKAVETYIEQFG